MLYHLIRPLLFRLDAERAHDAVFRALGLLEAVLVRTGYAPRPWTHPLLAQRLWDIDFPNPVGLAAGLDKNARAPHVWPLCGFGSAELGTVTAHGQPGNPKPRLFRVPRDRALINRMGFNNDGAATVARRLAALTSGRPPAIPIGINLGKSRATALDDAVSNAALALAPGGRVCILSYHSLEHRAVRGALRDLAKPCRCPPELPQCRCSGRSEVTRLTPKGVPPTAEEIEANPRSRSAQLWCAERV